MSWFYHGEHEKPETKSRLWTLFHMFDRQPRGHNWGKFWTTLTFQGHWKLTHRADHALNPRRFTGLKHDHGIKQEDREEE